MDRVNLDLECPVAQVWDSFFSWMSVFMLTTPARKKASLTLPRTGRQFSRLMFVDDQFLVVLAL